MRERIGQLAGGRVRMETPVLECSRETIEASIAYGQNYRGDIHFTSGNQLAFRGLISSDDSRVLLLQSTYAGTNIYIPYEVIADGLEEGSVLSGFFTLDYNGGEYQLPYKFTVLSTGKTQSVKLDTLEEFAEYARTNPREASELFETRDFVTLPFMEDLKVRGLYDGLRRAVNHRNLVEEFLCGTGTKKRVILTASEAKKKIELDVREKQECLGIHRSTWGWMAASVSVDNDAVVLGRDSFTDQDFQDDIVRLEYTIVPEKLHAGHNYARITVKAPLQTLTLELDMFCQPQNARSGRKLHEKRGCELEFHKTMLRVLALEKNRTENLDMLQYCWDEMIGDQEPDAVQLLYRAAISCWRGDHELAAASLERAKPVVEANRRTDVDTYCAYLHLQVMVTDQWERREQMLKILNLYEGSGDISEKLFLVKLFLEGFHEDRPAETLEKIRGYYQAGSRSPYLYLAACRIYNQHPDILKRLDTFELHTLLFGSGIGMLTETTASHVASMAGLEKGYRSVLCRILKNLFRTYDRDDILGGICQLLIRSDRRSREDFRWFAKGVERDIRLTRLYDYYLYTVPADYSDPFPREIMLYFSYNSPRDPESQRVLYRNLYRHSPEDADIMRSYRDQLKEYVDQQIRSQRIDRDTARILSGMLDKNAIDENMAKILPDLLKSREITTDYKGFTEVIAVYGETEEEYAVPMRDGVAGLPVYTNRCRLIFSDETGTRYAGIPCREEILFEKVDAILDRCLELCPKHSLLRMAQCSRILSASERTAEQIRFLRREMDTRGFRREYKREIMSAITDYVISRKDPDDEDVIACVHYSGITAKQRNRLVQILIEQGQLTEAAGQARRIGFRELPNASLLRLVSLTIQNGLFAMDETLLDMSYYLFLQRQCDDVILEYLCTHFNSSCRRMHTLLAEAARRNIPLHGMEERLLAQMLFTGVSEGMEDVFRIYKREGTGDLLLEQAYYAVKCRDYFMEGTPAEGEVFDYVRQMMEDPAKKKLVPEICQMAYCRHLAAQHSLTEEEKEYGREIVFDLYRRGLIFAWMKNLQDKICLPHYISQREWLESHGEPDQALILRSSLQPDPAERGLTQMVMPQVYPGIYTCSVLLYEGETLSYEILREDDRAVLKRGVLNGKSSPEEDNSSYAMLNRLQMQVQNENRVQQWQQAVLDLAALEVWTEQLFTTE